MKLLLAAIAAPAVLCAQSLQFSNPIEDYCYHSDAPTCRDGQPFDIEAITKTPFRQWCDKNPNEPMCQHSAPASGLQRTAATPFLPLLTPTRVTRPAATHAAIRPGEIDWRLIQPNSDMLIGVNMADLLRSDLARTMIGDWMAKLGATAEEKDKLLASLNEISEVVISVRGNRLLAVLIGHVNDLPEGAQAGPMQWMKVSADTAVLGSPEVLQAAAQRLRMAAVASASVREPQGLARTNQVWLWGKPSALGAPSLGATADKVRFGANIRDGFRMDVSLDVADPATARRMLERSRNGAPPEMHASIEGNSVRYTLTLDRAAVLQRFAALLDDPAMQQMRPLLAAARQIATTKSSVTAPRVAGKIVIEGLDEGRKEIPFGSQQ